MCVRCGVCRIPPPDLERAVIDHWADLMAIGAFDSGNHAWFGHGAGARAILAQTTAPVLFSH